MTTAPTPAVRSRTPRGQGRAKLVLAASGLFAEQGVNGTSLQDIADKLGVTKAAVYHQFASKEQIVIAVAEPVIDRLSQIADAASARPAAHRVRATIEGLVDLVLSESGTAAIMRSDPSMAQTLSAHEAYLQQITRIDALLLGPDPSAERRIALAFAGGGIMSIGGVPGMEGAPGEVRSALIAAMERALAI